VSQTYEFQCETFFVATISENNPAVRPFGAVMEFEEALYFSTANTKAVYLQFKSNPAIQIIALKSGTREWIRINGNVVEIDDLDMKQKMLDECPSLSKRFDSNKSENFALFKLTEMTSALNINGEFTELT